jgi:hypothetical protein
MSSRAQATAVWLIGTRPRRSGVRGRPFTAGLWMPIGWSVVETVRAGGAKRRARRFRGGLTCDSLVWLVFAALGVGCMWSPLVVLPQRYDGLADDGIPTVAHVRCNRDCELTMSYNGRGRTWTYHQPREQFRSVPYRGSVPMLVDRRDPQIAYTVYDVQHRSNAGFGVLAGFGLLVILGSVGAALWEAAWPVRLRARIDEACEQAPRPRFDHLSVLERARLTRTLRHLDGADRLVQGARAAPLSRSPSVRVDRRAFLAEMEAMRGELRSPAFERPPERSLTAVDHLIATAQQARTLPLTGGIGLPLYGTLLTLVDLRLAVLEAFDAVSRPDANAPISPTQPPEGRRLDGHGLPGPGS